MGCIEAPQKNREMQQTGERQASDHMNIAGTLNALRLFYQPSLFMPQAVVSHFGQLPVPLVCKDPSREVKVVVLDKDNCFAKPHADEVWPDYRAKWAELRAAYPGSQLLIVSNTAGSDDDPGHAHARRVEHSTGVKVFKHSSKKPGCYREIMQYVEARGLASHPSEVAVVGDRLMTDVAMANLMGASSVWVRDGVVPNASVFSAFERAFYDFMKHK